MVEQAEREENEEFTTLQRQLDADERQRMTKAVQVAEALATDDATPRRGVGEAELCRWAFRVAARPCR
ncbi:hypothetical protein MGAST_04375 [Mycobacterium gastri 'Wayne']|nr:hypothetical protein MGAST_04375 [Mycobacterium gastri 'Wayne']